MDIIHNLGSYGKNMKWIHIISIKTISWCVQKLHDSGIEQVWCVQKLHDNGLEQGLYRFESMDVFF